MVTSRLALDQGTGATSAATDGALEIIHGDLRWKVATSSTAPPATPSEASDLLSATHSFNIELASERSNDEDDHDDDASTDGNVGSVMSHGNGSTANANANTNADAKGDETTVPKTVLRYEQHLNSVKAQQSSVHLAQLSIAEHLKIIFEDDDLIVTDKPSGVLCVPGLQDKPNLLDLVHEHCSATCDATQLPPASCMIVHRLDMDTSGLVIFAKNATSLRSLQAAFRDRQVNKEYQALVCGHVSVPSAHCIDVQKPQPCRGHIHLALQRDHEYSPFMRISTPQSEVAAAQAVKDLQAHGWKKLVMKRPKPSHTEIAVLDHSYLTVNPSAAAAAATAGGADNDMSSTTRVPPPTTASPTGRGKAELPVTRLSLIPHTGRTHQLRVHCAALGYPIFGDPAYGLHGDANPRGGLQGHDSDATSISLQQSIRDAYSINCNASRKPAMCLHAARLELKHPRTGDLVTFEAPVPF